MIRMIWGITVSVLAVGSADAALLGRLPATLGGSDYQAYYDTEINITWLADANLAATNTFGASGIYPSSSGGYYSGAMNWDAANEWIWLMNRANYLGKNDWRLPLTVQPDPSCSDHWDPGSPYPVQGGGYGCTGSEMGHLFNVDEISSSSPGPFSNMIVDFVAAYWSDTTHPPTNGSIGGAWAFYFNSGYGLQNIQYKPNDLHAWAVRPGDIGGAAGAVPVPGTVWLFGTGLAALGAKLKRRVRGAGTVA